jgi:delta 1-pyrroline-5-carboxylate dehydrogenase
MASEVRFRIPHTTKHFFGEMLELLDTANQFPNIIVSTKERLEFLKERSAVLEDPATGQTKPVTDAVIFTGTYLNAEKLRLVFDKRTLFISNGSGHNPLVVAPDGNLHEAVEAATRLQFYNQGQDCAAPNAILVHKDVSHHFMDILREKVHSTKVGPYEDRSSIIGPISNSDDLSTIQELLVENRAWLDPSTPGIISTRDAMVSPTIICKPLSEGGNFLETYAPIIFVQEYDSDEQLAQYFEDRAYPINAMYITLYGTSDYIESLIGKHFNGRILLDQSTLVHNTHLHAPGIERGTQPYGGYGLGASSISINGKLIPKPTLPQRDIYEWLVQPVLDTTLTNEEPLQFTETVYKNVSKLLQIKLDEEVVQRAAHALEREIYIDAQQLVGNENRYAKIDESNIYVLLKEPNTSYAATLDLKDLKLVQELLPLLDRKATMSFDDFRSELYAIPKRDANGEDPKALLRNFFQKVYQLLFGRNDGPRLIEFLWNVEPSKVTHLLDVTDVIVS